MEARARPAEFRSAHLVVLVDSVTDEKREYGSIPIALPVQVHERRQLTKAQLRFATAAAGDGGRDSTFVRAAKPGEPSVALRTARRERTAVSLGSASVPVGGGRMRFHFDARPPEVSPLGHGTPGVVESDSLTDGPGDGEQREGPSEEELVAAAPKQ